MSYPLAQPGMAYYPQQFQAPQFAPAPPSPYNLPYGHTVPQVPTRSQNQRPEPPSPTPMPSTSVSVPSRQPGTSEVIASTPPLPSRPAAFMYDTSQEVNSLHREEDPGEQVDPGEEDVDPGENVDPGKEVDPGEDDVDPGKDAGVELEPGEIQQDLPMKGTSFPFSTNDGTESRADEFKSFSAINNEQDSGENLRSIGILGISLCSREEEVSNDEL